MFVFWFLVEGLIEKIKPGFAERRTSVRIYVTQAVTRKCERLKKRYLNNNKKPMVV